MSDESVTSFSWCSNPNNFGPDPAPHEGFSIDAYLHRWPSGAEKVELWAGALVFYGQFDDRDVLTAERTYPGRRVVLNEDGGIEVHPMPG